jgi:hypothetical protein
MLLLFEVTKKTMSKLVKYGAQIQRINRWPFNVFMIMLDVAAYNAYSL